MPKHFRTLARSALGLCVPILGVLTLLPARASAQQPERLDPVLREALTPASRAAFSRLPRATPVAPGQEALPPSALAVDVGDDGNPRIGIFVRLANRSGIDAIRALGGVVGAEIGDIVTARVPLDRLEELSAAPGIAFIEAARAVRAEHDSSMKAIHVDEIRTLSGNTWLGAIGEGALVGVYDTGIDLDHQDFRDDQGRSRVISAWDQTTQGNPPTGFTSGFVCDSAAIARRVQGNVSTACPVRDLAGHGTHVAGSAAGDGSATGDGRPAFRYAGVAPGAKLLVVKGGNGSFFENLVVDGLRWLRDEAARLDRPVVVNVSLGGQFGPHDGSRLYELAIDELSGPGFMVVISAGNQGVNRNTVPATDGRLFHARTFAIGTETQTFTLTLPPHTPNSDRCNGNVSQIGVWYDSSDRLRLEVVRPSGTSLTAATRSAVQQEHAQGRIVIDNASAGVDPRNGDNGALIRIDGCGASGAPEVGTWLIRATPEAAGSSLPYDIWIETSSHGTGSGTVQLQGSDGFDNRFVIASPGNATRGITVAAFATRHCWPSQGTTGTSCYIQREEVGDLARFSSGGPRRDGFPKPEITAPGIGVMSTKAANVSFGGVRTEPDGVHVILEGTSMAAPHVTGTIAVLYQAKPDLTPEEAKAILMATAAQDAFTIRTYDPAGAPLDWWGAGKLNAHAALVSITGSGPAILSLATDPATPDGPTLSPRGTRLPLLALRLSSRGAEAIDVTRLTFEVSGEDPGAYLVLLHDVNNNNQLDDGDVPIDSVAAPLSGAQQSLSVSLDANELRVPALRSVSVIAALSLSGAAPHGGVFEATFVPGETRSVGLISGQPNVLSVAPTPLESGPAGTTVLAADELLSFSENPVLCPAVVFNFAEPPTTAAIYTLAGRRLIGFPTRGAMRVEWDLRNQDGGAIAPGVYLVVFTVRGQLFREKLLVSPRQNIGTRTCPGVS
jgi:subtilisin family serine protease